MYSIRVYSQRPQSFYSTLDMEATTDDATVSKIQNFCRQRFGLVDVRVEKGMKLTLSLHGFKHEQAKAAVIERFLKDAPENLRFPREWADIDEIKNGS